MAEVLNLVTLSRVRDRATRNVRSKTGAGTGPAELVAKATEPSLSRTLRSRGRREKASPCYEYDGRRPKSSASSRSVTTMRE